MIIHSFSEHLLNTSICPRSEFAMAENRSGYGSYGITAEGTNIKEIFMSNYLITVVINAMKEKCS